METTPEAEWPDEFTREEMLEQQSRLLIEEIRMVQQELSRYRKNMAKLIDMLNDVTVDRDTLRKRLERADARISNLQTDTYESSRIIGSLERILAQREAVMRTHNIPQQFFGEPWTSV
jgi:regulator of replication initiation timing